MNVAQPLTLSSLGVASLSLTEVHIEVSSTGRYENRTHANAVPSVASFLMTERDKESQVATAVVGMCTSITQILGKPYVLVCIYFIEEPANELPAESVNSNQVLLPESPMLTPCLA